MRDDPPSSPPHPTRRTFLVSTGGTAAAALVAGCAGTQSDGGAGQGDSRAEHVAGPHIEGAVPITLRINGKEQRLRVDPRTTLLDCLRENVALTGTKKGCDHGQCGACTVHADDKRVNACLMLAVACQGKQIKTIEGLASGDDLHPVQKAFIEHDGFQCGYCTPGQIMSAVALLAEGRAKTDDEVRELMSGNICRCGAYPNIVAAVQAARNGAGG